MEARDLFEILAREHADMLLAYLRAVLHDDAAADDLFQETLLAAWKALDRFDRTRPFGPWLRGIAGKLVLAHRRWTAGAVPLDERLLAAVEARAAVWERQPGDTLDEKLEALRRCLAALPPDYRAAVELRYREDLGLPELAQRLRAEVDTVKKRLQRAKAKLLECLERRLGAQTV